MKKLIALILALALAAGLVPALADEEAAVETAAAETEAAAVAERKLLATVNGEEIWNDNRLGRGDQQLSDAERHHRGIHGGGKGRQRG